MFSGDAIRETDATDIDLIRRKEFPITQELTFFNHAACSPLPNRAALAIAQQATEQARHGNLGNAIWSKNREDARNLAAGLLNAEAAEIAFVGNTADGLNFVANGITWADGDNIVTTSIEYPANMYPWMKLSDQGVQVKVVRDRNGRIEADDLAAAIDGRTKLLAISWVEFSSGFMNDLATLGTLCRERGVIFLVDAIQGLGAFPIDVQAMGIDALACGGQKWLLGPRGCGIFYCSPATLDRLKVSVVGAYSVVDDHNYLNYDLTYKPGAFRFEYGTENAAGIAGLRASLALLREIGADTIASRIRHLTGHFCALAQSKGYTIDSSRRRGEDSGLVFFSKPNQDANALGARLQEERFILSVRDGRLRFAPHFYNTEQEIDALVAALP